jgi:thiol-disulfide isomerase/thioredoxin
LLIVSASTVGAQAPKIAKGIEPAPFERPFPGGVFANLNKQAGGPESIDLGSVIGKRPVVLFYWIAGNPRADKMFQELEAVAKDVGGERLTLFGVAMLQPGRGADVIDAKLRELKIASPVLDDEGFVLGQRLRIKSVPNITILDAGGNLRMTNAAALTQDLEYKMTVETAIRRVAEKGSLSTYGYLPTYYPAVELKGQDSPDFEAPLLSDGTMRSWLGMLSKDKPNALIFWSIDCPHCRKELPRINEWLQAHPGEVNVVSVARAANDAIKTRTKEFCGLNEFVFPTFVDSAGEIAQLFLITSTPTTMIVGPDGTVDAVLISTMQDFGKAIEKLKSASPRPAS